MLLPIDGGPGWLEVLSKFNPLTYVVDAERVLFEGSVWDASVLQGVAAALAVLVVGIAVGTRAVRGGADA